MNMNTNNHKGVPFGTPVPIAIDYGKHGLPATLVNSLRIFIDEEAADKMTETFSGEALKHFVDSAEGQKNGETIYEVFWAGKDDNHVEIFALGTVGVFGRTLLRLVHVKDVPREENQQIATVAQSILLDYLHQLFVQRTGLNVPFQTVKTNLLDSTHKVDCGLELNAFAIKLAAFMASEQTDEQFHELADVAEISGVDIGKFAEKTLKAGFSEERFKNLLLEHTRIRVMQQPAPQGTLRVLAIELIREALKLDMTIFDALLDIHLQNLERDKDTYLVFPEAKIQDAIVYLWDEIAALVTAEKEEAQQKELRQAQRTLENARKREEQAEQERQQKEQRETAAKERALKQELDAQLEKARRKIEAQTRSIIAAQQQAAKRNAKQAAWLAAHPRRNSK